MEISETGTHPLENPLILSNVFSNISDLPNLRNMRLVSTLWRNMCLEKWRSLATLRLAWQKHDCSGSPISYHRCNCPEIIDKDILLNKQTLEVAQFLQLCANDEESFLETPFARYRLIGYCIDNPSTYEDDRFQLFEMFGREMKYLNLDHVCFHVPHTAHGIQWLLDKCVNLIELSVLFSRVVFKTENPHLTHDSSSKVSKLTLGSCKKDPDELGDHTIGNILKLFPALETFRFTGATEGILAQLIRQLISPLGHSEPIRLTSLELLAEPIEYEAELFSALTQYVGLVENKLESLKLIVNGFTLRDTYRVQEVLRKCQGTLKDLELQTVDKEGYYSKEDFNFRNMGKFPGLQFPCLESLSLYGESRGVSLPLLNKTFPNLRRLHVKTFNMEDGWDNVLFAEKDKLGILFEKLEHLHINLCLSNESIRILAKWMPNLKRLEISLSEKESLNALVGAWPNLEKISRVNVREIAYPQVYDS